MPPIAILAGGLATRLRPLTETIPKSMVEVAGRPFIEHQLRLLVREGIIEVVVCSGHLGEQIEEFVGDGARFGCRVRYSSDGGKQLGTGGALKRALPMLGKCCMVMYGDSYLDTNFRAIFVAFQKSGQPALMTVCLNDAGLGLSNAEFANGTIVCYDKVNRTSTMRHIDYGLAVLDTEVVRSWPATGAFDLAETFGDLARRKLLAGYEVQERFYEIGSPEGLAETDAFIRRTMYIKDRS